MNHIFTNDGFTVFFGGTSYQVNKEHPNFLPLKECVKTGDEIQFSELFVDKDKVQAAVRKTNDERVTYENGQVYYNGVAVHNSLSCRIRQLAEEGFDYSPLIKFLDNLMNNPSANSVNELYTFLERRNLPITDDGCFLAYKSVGGNFLDKYSGTIDNSVGTVHRMERNQVDDDKNSHCSHGYHVGALEYSGPGGWYNSSGDNVVVCKVNPADAVSVPTDHSFTKLRVCAYEVLCTYKEPLNNANYTSTGDKIDNPKLNIPEYYDVDEVLAGDTISFTYTKVSGETSERHYMYVEDIDGEEGYVWCREDGVIQPKRFIMDNMSKIVLELDTDECDDDYCCDEDCCGECNE